MAQRKRKRSRGSGRQSQAAGRDAAGSREQPGEPASPEAAEPKAAPAKPIRSEHPAIASYRARSEERNAAARATLRPLAPGERPWPLVAAALVALALGAVTLALYLAGVKLSGSKPPVSEVIVYCGLMLVCAAGCWRMRYWAVLGFQTLLAIGILGLALALIRVNSVLWALVCLVVIAAGGYLFWKLVRVLGRLQMPAPPGR